MLEVQRFLINEMERGLSKEEAFAELTKQFGIKVQSYDHYVGLNYDQIESPKSHPIVMECRALVLHRDTLAVARRAFDRFFNYNECPEFYNDFDIGRAKVFEKEDGSLIPMWFDFVKGTWEVGTRSMIFAEGDHIMGGTFREKIFAAFGIESEEEFQEKMFDLETQYTYIFEYVGPSNRIVRRYEKDEMVLLAIRDKETGNYLSHFEVVGTAYYLQNSQGLNVRPVKIYNMGSFHEIIAAIKELPALEEGYVCFDPVSGKRVKLKNPSYVAIHQMRGEGQLSMKRVYSLVLENDHEEYLAYYPEDRVHFEPVVAAVKELEKKLHDEWEEVKDIVDQKDFALMVKDLPFSGVLFMARKRKTDPVRIFHEMDMNKKLRLFGF
jgi:T4 RnlA family RNA ligase